MLKQHVHDIHTSSDSVFTPDAAGKEAFLDQISAEFGEKLSFSCTKKWNALYPGFATYTISASLPADIADQYTSNISMPLNQANYTLMFPESKSIIQSKLDAHSAGLFATIDSIIAERESEMPNYCRTYELEVPYVSLSLDHKTMAKETDYLFAQGVISQLRDDNEIRLATIASVPTMTEKEERSIAIFEYLSELPTDSEETVAITPADAFTRFEEIILSQAVPVKTDK